MAKPEISQGKTQFFHKVTPDLPLHASGRLLGFSVYCQVTLSQRPYIRFLFVATLFCHQLPSDSTSRRTPLYRLAVPITTARRGLSPPRTAPCLAHNYYRLKAVGLPTLAKQINEMKSRNYPVGYAVLGFQIYS
jgi:hypothetical protein